MTFDSQTRLRPVSVDAGLPESRRARESPAKPARRGLSLGAYFAGLVAAVLLVGTAAGLDLNARLDANAKHAAQVDAGFASKTAAQELQDGTAKIRATVAALASNPGIGQLFVSPGLCSLTYAGISGLRTGHIDILGADGSVLCSSRAAGTALATPYVGAAWLASANRSAQFLAPVSDPTTGQHALLTTAPVPGKGIVAIFAALEPVGADLAQLTGGSHPLEFIVTTASGTVITRSINPSKWVGKPVAGTPFAGTGAATEGPDVDGTTRLYAAAGVAGMGWQVHAGADKASVLAASNNLLKQELLVILVGFAAVAVAAAVLYRFAAVPIAQLGAEVRSRAQGGSLAPVPVRGPTQVRALAEDVNHLFTSVKRELAERRRVERGAQASEENYRLLFDSNPIPMLIFDNKNLAILETNEAATKHYGYSRDEFLGLTIRDVAEDADLPVLTGESTDGQQSALLAVMRHKKKDGMTIEVAGTVHTVVFRGESARFVTVEDVGERERLERQLRQSQRLESLGQLAGGVAHDFNNLLGVILNYTSFVKEQVTDAASQPGGARWASSKNDLEQVEEAGRRAASLTHQLLAFARREVVLPAVISVNDVITSLEQLLRRTIGEQTRLSTSLCEDVWPVEMDPGQLEQVLVNLAINARDAMPGGGMLRIDTANQVVDEDYLAGQPGVSSGRYVRIRVSDTGPGMDESTLQRVFEPFFTTKAKGEGSGLGLATVYGIVTQAGGRARIYSELGHGTTFTALLPVAATATAEGERIVEASAVGGTETILVVEDEAALREVTVRMLRRHGYQVLSASGGLDALDVVGGYEAAIDLLITDVVMPGILGREVAKEITAIRPNIRVLFISGYAQTVLGSQGTLDAGVELLEKPFSELGLLARVRGIIDAPVVR
jgi:PAS domain S-box-containing protein